MKYCLYKLIIICIIIHNRTNIIKLLNKKKNHRFRIEFYHHCNTTSSSVPTLYSPPPQPQQNSLSPSTSPRKEVTNAVSPCQTYTASVIYESHGRTVHISIKFIRDKFRKTSFISRDFILRDRQAIKCTFYAHFCFSVWHILRSPPPLSLLPCPSPHVQIPTLAKTRKSINVYNSLMMFRLRILAS